MKYQVIETRLNAKGDKVDVRVAISEEESIFLNLPIEPIGDLIDAEVDKYIAYKAQEKADKEALTLE